MLTSRHGLLLGVATHSFVAGNRHISADNSYTRTGFHAGYTFGTHKNLRTGTPTTLNDRTVFSPLTGLVASSSFRRSLSQGRSVCARQMCMVVFCAPRCDTACEAFQCDFYTHLALALPGYRGNPDVTDKPYKTQKHSSCTCTGMHTCMFAGRRGANSTTQHNKTEGRTRHHTRPRTSFL